MPKRAPREYIGLAERNRIASWSALRFVQAAPDYISLDDLRQEAHVAISLAHRSFDPLRGVPFGSYAISACIRWLSGYVGRTAAPVSGSTHTLLALSFCERAPLGDPIALDDLDEHVWRAEVRATLEAAVGAIGPAEVLFRILAGETSARHEVSSDLPVERIHTLTRQARRRLEESREMWQLWNER